MSTVGKAISLLELFTVAEPELGLSDLARRSGFDKATTRRLLVALTGHGLVEQDAATRHYRLGAGLSRLARIREARFPFLQTAVPLVRDLASATAETVHLSEYGIDRLVTVHVEHPARANRVNVDIGQLLPLHST
ncbi:MAG: IclR family transcriptional regulator, partial [Mesorhizobium sp.]